MQPHPVMSTWHLHYLSSQKSFNSISSFNYFVYHNSVYMIESKAAIADGNGTYAIETIFIDDTPVGDEVLIQIKAAGVCHTDWDS